MKEKLKQHYITIKRVCAEYDQLSVEKDTNLLRQCHLVSAGLLNYMPSIDYKNHDQIFKKILFHQKLSLLEQGLPELLNDVHYEDLEDAITFLKKTPSIICTFHLGSYRLINLLLGKHKILFSLVVAKSVIDKHGDSFQSDFQRTTAENIQPLELIDAEHPGSALQMIKAIKKGKCLVVYLDGNTGSGQQARFNENCTEINFLHQKLMVRKGVGFLSHVAKAPVLPVLCYRAALAQISIKFFEPIIPSPEPDRNKHAEELIQQIYALAEPYIARFPEQWEAWLYLYKVAVVGQNRIQPVSPPQQVSNALTFNRRWFGLYHLKNHNYIFDKHDFLSYEISAPLYDFLSKTNNQCIKTESIDVILLQDLYRKGVLIAS